MRIFLRTGLLAIMLICAPAQAALSGDAARALFARIKTLAGDWEGKSTSGWA